MLFAVTLSNGVTGHFEAESEAEAIAAAQADLERLSNEMNEPIPEGLKPENAEVVDGS